MRVPNEKAWPTQEGDCVLFLQQTRRGKVLRICHENFVRVDWLDSALWTELIARLDEERIIEGVRALRLRAKPDLETKVERLKSVNAEIEGETKRIRNYSRLSGELGEDNPIIDEYRGITKDASRHKDALTAERGRLEGECDQLTAGSSLIYGNVTQFQCIFNVFSATKP